MLNISQPYRRPRPVTGIALLLLLYVNLDYRVFTIYWHRVGLQYGRLRNQHSIPCMGKTVCFSTAISLDQGSYLMGVIDCFLGLKWPRRAAHLTRMKCRLYECMEPPFLFVSWLSH
jgi:hypothetical protein